MSEFNDEHAGKGGSYVIENGRRVLQERTVSTAVKQPDASAQEKPINKQKVKGEKNA